MSAKIERNLRKKCKDIKDNETPLKLSKSVSNKNRKLKSVSSSTIDFNSETLSSSSPVKLDVYPEKRSRKKKIRSTQDFNYLSCSSSVSSQDSEKSSKSKTKKAKKSNKACNLPRILLVDDFSLNPQNVFSEDELNGKNRIKVKSKKHNCESIIEDTNCGKHTKKLHKIKQDTEEYLSENSISDSRRDSDEKIVIKDKRKLKKKKRKVSDVNVGDDTEEEKTDRYAKRIKKLLSNTLIRSSKSNSSSCLSTPISEKKSEQNKTNTKEIKCEGTPKVARPSFGGDNQAETEAQPVSARLSRRISSTPHPKIKLSSPYVYLKEKENQSISRRSRTNLSENVSPEPQTMRIKNKKSSTGGAILSVNVSFNVDFDSDDVFNDTFEKDTGIKSEECLQEKKSINNVQPRKSVRFQSPAQNTRRETMIISKSITDHPEDCTNNDITLIQTSSSECNKINETFEITSPNQSVPQNQVLFYREDTPYKRQTNTSKRSMRSECSTQLSSPMNKSLRKSRTQKNSNTTTSNSIIDLTTPIPFKEIDSGVTPSSEKSNNDVLIQVPTESVHADNTTTPAPYLARTATFVKDNESRDLPLDMKYSPFPSDKSYSKILDTSKVNKRKRWDKSRLSVSLLDNSLDIGNISAPWKADDSINTLHDSDTNDRKSTKINDSRLDKVSTPPSGTSTPYGKSRSNLLRRALLKNKPDVTLDESKNRGLNVQKPLPKVRTKIPNFALIHQRAYDRLENIKELSERKAARAKLLLSGRKPPNEDVSKTSSKRKELKFSPGHLKSLNNTKDANKSLNKSNISVTKIKKMSPSTSNPKVANKENRLNPIKKKQFLEAKSLIPKSKLHNRVMEEKKNFTRFGFKIGSEGVKKASKDEQVKAVASKSKILKNTLEDRRTVIQGVRSNRRFELLMNMRMK